MPRESAWRCRGSPAGGGDSDHIDSALRPHWTIEEVKGQLKNCDTLGNERGILAMFPPPPHPPCFIYALLFCIYSPEGSHRTPSTITSLIADIGKQIIRYFSESEFSDSIPYPIPVDSLPCGWKTVPSVRHRRWLNTA